MEGMDKLPKKPIKITDTTFRDGHQSTLATRMRTEDMTPIAQELDSVGFHSVEMWGGATFDVCHRFLGEDPWERVRVLKKLMPKTPFQMLLRGQNLVAYRNHPDDVVEAFVEKSAEVGIDIFRCFDAVNDERNFETAFKVIKRCGKHIQGTICYSLTERRMGGPVYNLNYYLEKAKILENMGADSLCIKDMAGLLAPYDAYELVKALKQAVQIPIQLHTHYTSGMGSMTYLKAIEAGVDIIDTALAPFALRSSQPAVEPILVALEGTPWDPKLDLSKLLKLGEYLETIAPKYRDFLDTTKMAVIDTSVLRHQIPGGMISNMISQLKQQKAL
ncbi:MAG: pyruvate carboxylase subunit B, partial [Thermodesulfobacteriota bacterium]